MKNAVIRDWNVIVVTKAISCEQRIAFGKTLVEMLYLGFCNIVMTEDIPFILVGIVYDDGIFCNGSKVRTAPVKRIKQGSDRKHFIVETMNGLELGISLMDMSKWLRIACMLPIDRLDQTECFASFTQYTDEKSSEEMYDFLEGIKMDPALKWWSEESFGYATAV